MINYYVQHLTKQIIELKTNNGSKEAIQNLQQKLDKAIKIANEVNKDNNEL